MGTFRQPIEVGPLDGSRYVAVEALVDTGSTYTSLPSSMLRLLGVAPLECRSFELADSHVVEADVGAVQVRVDGRSVPTLCVFAEEGTEPIMGAHALEGLMLAVDPVGLRLIPVRGRRMKFAAPMSRLRRAGDEAGGSWELSPSS